MMIIVTLKPSQEGEEVDEEGDEDEEYTPVPEITGPATSTLATVAPSAISRKRSRNEQEDDKEEAEDLAGDYGTCPASTSKPNPTSGSRSSAYTTGFPSFVSCTTAVTYSPWRDETVICWGPEALAMDRPEALTTDWADGDVCWEPKKVGRWGREGRPGWVMEGPDMDFQ